MALWTGWTREQLLGGIADLREAIASGAQRIHFADRDVTLQSVVDMERSLTGMVAALDVIDNPPTLVRRVRTIVVRDRSGW